MQLDRPAVVGCVPADWPKIVLNEPVVRGAIASHRRRGRGRVCRTLSVRTAHGLPATAAQIWQVPAFLSAVAKKAKPEDESRKDKKGGRSKARAEEACEVVTMEGVKTMVTRTVRLLLAPSATRPAPPN